MGGKGSGGHNRKSAAQRKAEGNAGKRKINKQEPTAPPATIEVPEGLTPIEQKFWLQLFPLVTVMKVMTSADVPALTQLCRALAEEEYWISILRQMRSAIGMKDLPAFVLAMDIPQVARLSFAANKDVRAYLAIFGLGPSFRAALQVDPSDDPPQDPLENVRRAKAASEVVQ